MTKAALLWNTLHEQVTINNFDVSWRLQDAVELSKGLDLLPAQAVGLELGTHRGASATFITQYTGMWLFSIDRDLQEETIANLSRQNIALIIGETSEIAKRWFMPVDFLFIDADHSYEAVKQDIAFYAPFLKKGGIIAGHDYSLPATGVKQAVDEAMTPQKWKKISCIDVWVFQKL